MYLRKFYHSLQDYKETEDPTIFHSVEAQRGPLRGDWMVIAFIISLYLYATICITCLFKSIKACLGSL